MYGIQDPVIRERSWRYDREITAEQLSKDIAYAEDIRFPVREWRGEDRGGRPLTVVWVAGNRTGRLFSAYEITGRSAWRYAHTGWSAHSSGTGAHTYWLACYVDGKQVAMYENSRGLPIRFKSYETARHKAAEFNKAAGIAD